MSCSQCVRHTVRAPVREETPGLVGRAHPWEFQPGDHVLLSLPTTNGKCLACWQGPLTLRDHIGSIIYHLQQPSKRKCTQVYHINLLKCWTEPLTLHPALATTPQNLQGIPCFWKQRPHSQTTMGTGKKTTSVQWCLFGRTRSDPSPSPTRHQMTLHPEKLKWTSEAEHAFQVLKKALTTTPILRNPDFDRSFFIHMDALETGLVTKWAIMELRYFTLMTDHAHLQWMARAKNVNAHITWGFCLSKTFLSRSNTELGPSSHTGQLHSKWAKKLMFTLPLILGYLAHNKNREDGIPWPSRALLVHLTVSLKQSGQPPLTSIINKHFPPASLDVFFLGFHTILFHFLCVRMPGDQ